jgi:small subunit ribosomal protein S1
MNHKLCEEVREESQQAMPVQAIAESERKPLVASSEQNPSAPDLQEGQIVDGVICKIGRGLASVTMMIQGKKALLLAGDLSWNTSINMVGSLALGQTLRVQVLRASYIDPMHPNIAVGVKQLEVNPYLEFAEKHSAGDCLIAAVCRTSKRGIHVRINRNVEGLINLSSPSLQRSHLRASPFSIGEVIKVYIVAIDVLGGRVGLSLVPLGSRQRWSNQDFKLAELHRAIYKWGVV